MSEQIAMVRPRWEEKHRNYHLAWWKVRDITVLICQRKTKDMVQLCLESLLRFYPDIPILLVDGDSKDDSTLYLRYMAVKHPNITLWERPLNNGAKHSSHGVTMDEAIRNHIKTKYVLLLDSDTITERDGWVESMLSYYGDEYGNETGLYAIGSLMLVSLKNYGCDAPADDNDILRYAHPSCSMIDRDKYLELPPFVDHGAPCCYNMIEAAKKRYGVRYYPVDKFVSHLSGASWCEPRTIWPHDHDVLTRPFLSFVVDPVFMLPSIDEQYANILVNLTGQTDNDFEVILIPAEGKSQIVTLHEYNVHIDTTENEVYPIRYNVRGEYVCDTREWKTAIEPNYVEAVKLAAIEKKAPPHLLVGGLMCTERKTWQIEMIKQLT